MIGTTPIVKLDNTNASGDIIVELGFANTSTAQTFDGNVILSVVIQHTKSK